MNSDGKDKPASPKRVLVVASSNQGKLREVRALLEGLDVEVVPADQKALEGIEETGATFAENALIKARTVAERTGRAALADDSGLEVDALNGAPGVLSSRFAPTDEERNRKLLDLLRHVPDEKRTARFRCAVAIVTPEGAAEVREGTCEGTIAQEPRGCNGFGYDPVFLVPHLGRTFAELPPDEKNAISHRGQALRAAREVLAGLLA